MAGFAAILPTAWWIKRLHGCALRAKKSAAHFSGRKQLAAGIHPAAMMNGSTPRFTRTLQVLSGTGAGCSLPRRIIFTTFL